MTKLDAPATFQSTAAAFISACPDPDKTATADGPMFAVLKNGDARHDFCFQSGDQQKGIAGDMEFHARMNTTTTAGRQTVVWCYDSDRTAAQTRTSRTPFGSTGPRNTHRAQPLRGAPHVPTFRLSSAAAVGLPPGSAWLPPIA